MLSNIIKNLTTPKPSPLTQDDARLALAALLIRIAKTDGHFDPQESKQIDQILIKRYDLTSQELSKLRDEALSLEAIAPDTVRFTRALKEAVAYEERTHLIEALWSVVLADGVREDEENALLRLVASLLGISDKESALARLRAQKKLI